MAKPTDTKSHQRPLEQRAEHPPAEKQGRGIVLESEVRQYKPPPLLFGWHIRTLSQPRN